MLLVVSILLCLLFGPCTWLSARLLAYNSQQLQHLASAGSYYYRLSTVCTHSRPFYPLLELLHLVSLLYTFSDRHVAARGISGESDLGKNLLKAVDNLEFGLKWGAFEAAPQVFDQGRRCDPPLNTLVGILHLYFFSYGRLGTLPHLTKPKGKAKKLNG